MPRRPWVVALAGAMLAAAAFAAPAAAPGSIASTRTSARPPTSTAPNAGNSNWTWPSQDGDSVQEPLINVGGF